MQKLKRFDYENIQSISEINENLFHSAWVFSFEVKFNDNSVSELQFIKYLEAEKERDAIFKVWRNQ